MATPDDVLSMMSDEGVEFVDFRFADLPGLMHHYTLPPRELSAEVFEDGLGFDGSSIRGFQEIQESDMLLVPDPDTAVMDPFRQHRTMILNCFIKDPVTGENYSRDPRYVAKKAEEYLKGTGIADTAYFGPEPEFFILDDIRFDSSQRGSFYQLDSIESQWNTGRDEQPNLGYKPRYKQGYFPVPPMDHFTDLRSEMAKRLEEAGIQVELQHHEVGQSGQAEIDIRFDTLLRQGRQADAVQVHREVHGARVRQDGDVHAEAGVR